jgi:hypothetical protein
MKKITTTLMAALFGLVALAQNDKMIKQSGEKLEVKVSKVGEWTISYTYPGETAEQTISKYAVAKIEYASGRKEDISEKVVVSGEDDWEKVVILEDKAAAVGLKKLDEIRGKTNAVQLMGTAARNDKKSLMKLKKAAAAMGAPFILMTSDKDNQFTGQAIKKGIAYSYK